MQKSKLIRKGRKGFTLVEVALAVAVGLIVIGGAIVGFNAVRENASNSGARQKVDAAVAIVENLAAANNQIYPASNATTPSAFSRTWQTQRPDWNANPWGGSAADTTDGVTEVTAATLGSAADPMVNGALPAATTATVDAASLTAAGVEATGVGPGNIMYQTAAPGQAQWGVLTDGSDLALKSVKGYYISLYDKNGQPFWYVKGGH